MEKNEHYKKAIEIINDFSLVNSYEYEDEYQHLDRHFSLSDEDAIECAILHVNKVIKIYKGRAFHYCINEYNNILNELEIIKKNHHERNRYV